MKKLLCLGVSFSVLFLLFTGCQENKDNKNIQVTPINVNTGEQTKSGSKTDSILGHKYAEEKGFITMEVEKYTSQGGYKEVEHKEGSGGKVMQAKDRNEDLLSMLHYDITVGNGGKWYIWVRAFAEHHSQNGMHIYIDGKPLKSLQGNKNPGSASVYLNKGYWSWKQEWQGPGEANHEGPIFCELSPGNHTLSIGKRSIEDPFLDKIILSHESVTPDGQFPYPEQLVLMDTAQRTPITPKITTLTIPCIENFEDGKAHDWTPVSGIWHVVQDKSKAYHVTITQLDSLARTVFGKPDWTDYTVEAKVKVTKWESKEYNTLGILTRYKDLNNYYILGYELGEWVIKKKHQGKVSKVASVPFSFETEKEYILKVVSEGDKMELHVNGEKKVEAKDGTLKEGFIGLISSYGDAYFDDIKIGK